MEKETERFEARDDEGNVYTLIVLTEMIGTTSTDSGGRSEIGGMKRLVLDDGSTVNVIDADTFRIFDSGKKLRRIR